MRAMGAWIACALLAPMPALAADHLVRDPAAYAAAAAEYFIYPLDPSPMIGASGAISAKTFAS